MTPSGTRSSLDWAQLRKLARTMPRSRRCLGIGVAEHDHLDIVWAVQAQETAVPMPKLERQEELRAYEVDCLDVLRGLSGYHAARWMRLDRVQLPAPGERCWRHRRLSLGPG